MDDVRHLTDDKAAEALRIMGVFADVMRMLVARPGVAPTAPQPSAPLPPRMGPTPAVHGLELVRERQAS